MTPLCLLHGFLGHPASFDPVLAHLPPCEVLRPTLCGHGAGTDRAKSFTEEVDRLAAVIREAGPGPFTLCGYSLGARLALGLLLQHGRLFAGATLLSVQPGLTTEEERSARIRADEEWALLAERRGMAEFVCRWEAQPLFASQARLPPQVRDAQRRERLSHDPAGTARCLRILSPGRMPDYRPRLSGLHLPVHLLCGAEDEKFCTLAGQMARLLPHSLVTLCPAAGHNLLLEAPAAVAAALHAALTRQDMTRTAP